MATLGMEREILKELNQNLIRQRHWQGTTWKISDCTSIRTPAMPRKVFFYCKSFYLDGAHCLWKYTSQGVFNSEVVFLKPTTCGGMQPRPLLTCTHAAHSSAHSASFSSPALSELWP